MHSRLSFFLVGGGNKKYGREKAKYEWENILQQIFLAFFRRRCAAEKVGERWRRGGGGGRYFFLGWRREIGPARRRGGGGERGDAFRNGPRVGGQETEEEKKKPRSLRSFVVGSMGKRKGLSSSSSSLPSGTVGWRRRRRRRRRGRGKSAAAPGAGAGLVRGSPGGGTRRDITACMEDRRRGRGGGKGNKKKRGGGRGGRDAGGRMRKFCWLFG